MSSRNERLDGTVVTKAAADMISVWGEVNPSHSFAWVPTASVDMRSRSTALRLVSLMIRMQGKPHHEALNDSAPDR